MSVSFQSACAAKRPLIGCVLTLPPTAPAKIVARAGYEWVMIDMEHSPFTAEQATNLVHAVIGASAGACLPIVRIPGHSVEWVKWGLDSGAAGIIIPMVNNRAEAEAIVNRALYPPRGARSFGPFNAPFGDANPKMDVASYFTRATNRDIAILPIIESREGIENAEEILGLDGISGVFIGPYDLRLSLGLPGGIDGPEPEFKDALKKVISIGKKLGKPIGCMGIGEKQVKERGEAGMSFLLSSIDSYALGAGLASDLENAKRGRGG